MLMIIFWDRHPASLWGTLMLQSIGIEDSIAELDPGEYMYFLVIAIVLPLILTLYRAILSR